MKKPTYRAPILILILVLLITAGAQYISVSRYLLETSTPDRDQWTESTSLWNCSGEKILSRDTNCTVGNYSIMCFVSNNTCIRMNITNIEVNCSGDEGYKKLFFWIRWERQNGTAPSSNSTLRLFSTSKTDYFECNLNKLGLISNSSDTWTKSNVTVGVDDDCWKPVGDAAWENITGLEFRLTWTVPGNLTLKIDDLYFGGKYVSPIVSGIFGYWLTESLIGQTLNFFLMWGVLAGMLLLTIKLYGGKASSWKVLLLLVGYTFSIRLVHVPISALLILTLPPLRLPVEVERWGTIYQEEWYPTLAYQLNTPLSLAVHVWTIALCAIILHSLYEFSWKKVVLISVLGYFLGLPLRALVPI